MTIYNELFKDQDMTADDTIMSLALLQAICSVGDEIRALRLVVEAALAGPAASLAELVNPGRIHYPFCAVCNCHHHTDNEMCILKGGPGAVPMTPRPAQSQAADVAAIFRQETHS